jgi:hypothetical protein
MAPLRTGARGDGAVEFATPDRSLPRNDSRARLIPELRSRNISSFRAGWVERAGKSLGKPIILEPAPLVQETVHDGRDSPSSRVGASITGRGFTRYLLRRPPGSYTHRTSFRLVVGGSDGLQPETRWPTRR